MTSLLVVFRIGRWRLGLECFQGHPSALLNTFDPGSSSIDPFDDTLNCLAAHQRHFDVVAGLGKRHGGSEPGLCLGYDKTLAWTSRTNQSCIVRARYLLSRGSAGTTHATRGSVAKTPYFSWNIFLSGSDNGRDRRIRAQSRLGWLGGDRDNSERISGELKRACQIRDHG